MKMIVLCIVLFASVSPAIAATPYPLFSIFRIPGVEGKWEVITLKGEENGACRMEMRGFRAEVEEMSKTHKTGAAFQSVDDSESVYSYLFHQTLSSGEVFTVFYACMRDGNWSIVARPVP